MRNTFTNTRIPVFDHIPFGILVINNGMIVDYQGKAEHILDIELDDMLEKSFSHIFNFPPPECSIFEKDATSYTEYKIVNEKHLLFLFTPIDGAHLLCTIQNVEDMKPLYDQLKQEKILNSELETIINASFDEIFVTDGDGVVLRINPAGEAFYGMTAEEIVGKRADKLGEEGLFSPVLYPIVKKRKERVSMIQRTRSGKTVHVIANPVIDSQGKISLIVFTSRDLTEVKYLREKIEKTESLLETYRSELDELKAMSNYDDIIAFSPNMRKILKVVNKVAPVDSTVLITGESGVGKGLIAEKIHEKSHREGPFIHINCGAIPETLIESELFGYEKGAFTGASKEGKIGLIEKANGGTLFLDEIGEMPLNLQVKILKTLQDKLITRVGGTKNIDIDVRFIAATNQDLELLVEEGKFRQDLYYRLNVIPIHIPPLRSRPEDIPYLIDFFLDKYNQKYHADKELSIEAENALITYNWPGNVRELENIIERLTVISEKKTINIDDLPEHISNQKDRMTHVRVTHLCTLKQAQEEMEEQLIRKAYDKYRSSYKVADVLGINQSTAFRKIQKYIKKGK